MDGFLILEDGEVFKGRVLGSPIPSFGEIVFTTSMQGYTESITDPSYAGQILTFSFPLIGNYGISWDHRESDNVWVRGIIASQIFQDPENRYSISSLDEFLKRYNVPALVNIDTRKLIRKIREKGTMLGVIYPGDPDKNKKDAVYLLENSIHPDKIKLFRKTASREIKFYKGKGNLNIALIDFGVKYGILKNLLEIGNVTLIPYYMRMYIDEFDAIVLSNGPGDPSHEDLEIFIENYIKRIKKPMLGICLGHQILARSFGIKTYKMKFGHRGVNHPVNFKEKVLISTHNHGFAISDKVPENIKITQRDINDGTVEGFVHLDLPVMGVQYHPEARPGTHDARIIFKEFERMVKDYAKG